MGNTDWIQPGFLETPGDSVADFRTTEDHGLRGDLRDGGLYRYSSDAKLAIRIALAVGRPLLVLGPSGCGKSSLVANLARLLQRRYYEFVVTSRSEAKDLFYGFDAVRRLGEAHVAGVDSSSGINWRLAYPFIQPGPLWWVYSPETARRRGAPSELPGIPPASDPGILRTGQVESGPTAAASPAVLLIDEIDKADPDFPNNLLVPLGSREFTIDETGDVVRLPRDRDRSSEPLVVITSNRERELPAAFVRRCVVLEIAPPKDDDLVEIACTTLRRDNLGDRQRWMEIAKRLREFRGTNPVSTAEFLDTVRAIEELKIEDGANRAWETIFLKTAWTQRDLPGVADSGV